MEREGVFHEHDVPRHVDATGDDVVAVIAAVVAGVAEEDASHRAGTELVRRLGFWCWGSRDSRKRGVHHSAGEHQEADGAA